ncbi:MAG: FAD-dependent oxidoreductase [Chthoniobacter sp.]
MCKLCRDGYFYEPSVAEKVFDTFVQEQPGLTVLKFHQFEKAHTIDGRITSVDLQDRATGQLRTLRGKAFIDATYEGDVYASAGAKFRLGREGRDTFGEPHAGEIIQDWRNQKPLGGSGLGDDRLPAYTYRLCLTANAENTVPLTSPPPAYDRTRYLGYLDDYQSGNWAKPNLTSMALSIAPIPNRKTDVNMNPRSIGLCLRGGQQGLHRGPRGRNARKSAPASATWDCSGFCKTMTLSPPSRGPWRANTISAKTNLPTTSTSPFSSTSARRAAWSASSP